VVMRTKRYPTPATAARPDVIRLPWLDMRCRGDGIYGALAGLRLEILPIENTPPDGPHMRLYVTQRINGVDRDRATPTRATRPARPGWAGVRERQTLAKSLAAIGMQARFADPDLQQELGLDDDPFDR
jgi:hypothetical protein